MSMETDARRICIDYWRENPDDPVAIPTLYNMLKNLGHEFPENERGRLDETIPYVRALRPMIYKWFAEGFAMKIDEEGYPDDVFKPGPMVYAAMLKGVDACELLITG